MTDLHLNTDGPRSGEYTIAVAAELAECVRVLNHHTMDAAALPSPSTINSVLGSLHDAVGRLDQLLRQLGIRLTGIADSGHLAAATGGAAVRQATAEYALGDAQRVAYELSARLARAYQATSGLYTTDQTDDEDGA
ncbi:hypothetical protein [Nonomuraea angiospora]